MIIDELVSTNIINVNSVDSAGIIIKIETFYSRINNFYYNIVSKKELYNINIFDSVKITAAVELFVIDDFFCEDKNFETKDEAIEYVKIKLSHQISIT